MGPMGPPAEKLQRGDVLAMVEEQFVELRRELNTQSVRIGQLQQQLNEIHSVIMFSALGAKTH